MIEVLFFDDNVTEIASVARAFELRTGLSAAYTDNVERALELVRTEQIKVAVLDQRMEEHLGITGTSLFDKIQEADRRVRGIIFSGESAKSDIIEANARGLRYLDKSCKPQELTQTVLTERGKYLAEAEWNYDRTAQKIGRYKGPFFSRSGQVIELLTVENLSTRTRVHPEDYRTYLEIRSGETRRETYSLTVKDEVLIEQESLTELETGLKLGVAAIKDLSLRVHESLKKHSQARSSVEVGRSLEETAQLSKADEQSNVIHRRVEMAPIFVQRRAILRITCECCGERRFFTLNLRQWSGRYHVRQVDTFRDKRIEVYDLGER